MEITSLNENDQWLPSPRNKVLGSIATLEDLRTIMAELNATGFREEEVSILCGRKGASLLDVSGEKHGFLGRIYRFVEKFGDMDVEHLKEYKEELLGGHLLIAVHVNDEEERKKVADILISHGGHRVNFYGRWQIENME